MLLDNHNKYMFRDERCIFREVIRHVIPVSILSVLCSSVVISANAELATNQGYWYLGEGAREGGSTSGF